MLIYPMYCPRSGSYSNVGVGSPSPAVTHQSVCAQWASSRATLLLLHRPHSLSKEKYSQRSKIPGEWWWENQIPRCSVLQDVGYRLPSMPTVLWDSCNKNKKQSAWWSSKRQYSYHAVLTFDWLGYCAWMWMWMWRWLSPPLHIFNHRYSLSTV